MIACSRKGCSNTKLDHRAILYKDGIPFCSTECANSANVKPMPLNLDINPDRLMAELNLQCAGYLYLNFNMRQAQRKAIAALKAYIGNREVDTIQVDDPRLYSPDDIAMGDYGFRIREKTHVEPDNT